MVGPKIIVYGALQGESLPLTSALVGQPLNILRGRLQEEKGIRGGHFHLQNESRGGASPQKKL